MPKNSCSNANRKAMILGFLLGASYHLLSFGAVMAAAQMETNWGVVQVRLLCDGLIATIAIPATVILCLYVLSLPMIRRLRESSQASSSSLSVEWTVLIGFIMANVALGTVQAILFSEYSFAIDSTAGTTQASFVSKVLVPIGVAINILVNVSLLLFWWCCFDPQTAAAEDEGASQLLDTDRNADDDHYVRLV